MDIVDLAEEHQVSFSLCLEDWSPQAKEAGPRRSQWIERFLKKGLRAKLAVDDGGAVGGMVQYLPIEQSFVDGQGLFFIPCIWVHGYRQGQGNFQKRGMGSALLEAAEADARGLGAKGMAAWGLWLPFWMKASWFKKHGYRKADRRGIAMLVWKPFAEDARAPRWFGKGKKILEAVPGKVTVTAFVNGWCMAANLVAERARRAAEELGDRVVYREIDTSERSVVAEWGLSDALFIDGKEVRTGPPPPYEKLRALIEKRVRRL
jgi:GNAT superfamily N-acetyltransferase